MLHGKRDFIVISQRERGKKKEEEGKEEREEGRRERDWENGKRNQKKRRIYIIAFEDRRKGEKLMNTRAFRS